MKTQNNIQAMRAAVLADVRFPVAAMPAFSAATLQVDVVEPATDHPQPFFGGYMEDDMLAGMGMHYSEDDADVAEDRV
ncbi:MAG: hypothetical protein WAX89_07565 [Alphaproteobacteria bacterium]